MSNFLLQLFFFFYIFTSTQQLWLFSSASLALVSAHPIPNNHHFPRVGLPPAMPHSHSPNHSALCSTWHGARRVSFSILTHLWHGNNGHPIHFQAIDPRDHKKERLLNQDKEVRSHMIVRQMKIQRCSRLEHLGQGYHPISWVGNAVSLCCLCLPHLTVWIWNRSWGLRCTEVWNVPGASVTLMLNWRGSETECQALAAGLQLAWGTAVVICISWTHGARMSVTNGWLNIECLICLMYI